VTEVVFLLAPRLHLLDLAGPAQALSTATDLGAGYRLHYVGEREDVLTAQGVALRAGTAWPELSADDLVSVPWRYGLGGAGPLAPQTFRRYCPPTSKNASLIWPSEQ
jgi:transcriptional regulator GlxA family with amidase domain